MGLLSDYFAASSDEHAATAIEIEGGPACADETDPPEAEQSFDTVPLEGIEPFVKMTTLEVLLTGRTEEEVTADPRNNDMVAMVDDGEVLVLTLTDSLRDALAHASDAALAQVAVPWARTGEFNGQANEESLAADLRELAGLARRALSSDQHLYCWCSV